MTTSASEARASNAAAAETAPVRNSFSSSLSSASPTPSASPPTSPPPLSRRLRHGSFTGSCPTTGGQKCIALTASAVPSFRVNTEGRSIQANVGVEFIGVSWS